MNKIYHTAIIGGGAAGLISAVDLLRGKNKLSGDQILILERLDRVGKKLIATGNGQGNLTNASISEENYYGDKKFIDDFLDNLKEIDLRKYFFDIGIPLQESKDGKIYPMSKQASSVLDIIRYNLEKNQVREQTGATVTKIKRVGKHYSITTKEQGEFFAKTVIVAVGGAAGKQFGTDGTSYAILQDLGHRKSKIYPSLVQLKTDLDKIRGLKGLKEVVNLTALKNGKKIKSSQGDLLFTEYGVSGSAVFYITSAIAGMDDVVLSVEFLPEVTEEEIVKILKDRKRLGYLPENDYLLGLVNKRIGQTIIKFSKEKTPEGIAKTLKNFTIPVKGDLGFNYAQVTKGGILTSDINSKTMESKLHDGLYIVGEVLDVDGDCGGYNLTFAFTSGITAAMDIKRRRED